MVERISSKEEKNPDINLRYGSMEAFVSPQGAYITKLICDGKDILFPDGIYRINNKEKRRGGMPILFPYAGPIENHPDWPQHGFARDMEWKDKTLYEDLEPREVLLELKSNKKTQEIFPYKFTNELKITLNENEISYVLTVINEDNKDMPVATGVHPYFSLPSQKLDDVRTNIKGLNLKNYQLAETLTPAMQKEVEINIPKIGEIKMILGGDFLRDQAQLWFWTDSPKYDYFCLEPCSVPVNGLLKKDEQILIPAGGKKNFIMDLQINPEFE
jgi:galactose mutarotase-like enzyme